MEIGECINSYEVTALFTPVAVEPAIYLIQHRQDLDRELQKNQINSLLHYITSQYIPLVKGTVLQTEGGLANNPLSGP